MLLYSLTYIKSVNTNTTIYVFDPSPITYKPWFENALIICQLRQCKHNESHDYRKLCSLSLLVK